MSEPQKSYKPIPTAAQVSENTTLWRLRHIDNICTHIKQDHEASNSFTPELAQHLEKIKANVKDAKLFFNNEILKKA